MREPRAQNLAVASNTSFSTLEQEVIKEINLARTRPAEYAAFLEQLRSCYVGKEFRSGKTALVTQEGVAALEEAIKYLRSAKPVPPLELSPGLTSGAKVLVIEQSASGATGHKGADGSYCEQRVGRFGKWTDPIGENLSYGGETARERVITFLIDDGFSNRAHRGRLLGANYRVAGIACGEHKDGGMCVITLAAGFTAGSGSGQPTPAKATTGARKF